MERSETFWKLAHRLNHSDVVVYVRFGRCSGGVSACLTLLSAGPGPRPLLVKLDRFGRSPSELIALLAHELQHADEVAGAPEVRDIASFQTFFERHGWKGSHGFETMEAEAITRRVAAELSR